MFILSIGGKAVHVPVVYYLDQGEHKKHHEYQAKPVHASRQVTSLSLVVKTQRQMYRV